MALVTGNYVTSAGTPLPAGAIPRIEAIPSKPAVTIDGQVISTESQTDAPNAASGAFVFNLIPTVDVLDAGFHYWIRGYYLVPNGYGEGSGYTRHDLFEQKLYVPTAGGQIGTLAAPNSRPFETWVVTDPAFSDANPPYPVIAGVLYLSADLDNPELGTGDLWKAVA